MPRWQYIAVGGTRERALDPKYSKFERTDLDGARYNSEMLTIDGVWVRSERLERYYLLGSNDVELVELSEPDAAALVAEAVRLGRFVQPEEPVVG